MNYTLLSFIHFILALLLLGGCTTNTPKEASNNDSGEVEETSDYQFYLKNSKVWIGNLSKERKNKREELISKLKGNPIYEILSTNTKAEFLSILNAVSNGITNTSYKGTFAVEDALLNQLEEKEAGKEKVTFVISVLALSLKENGGLPLDLIQIFERYREKYGSYKLKGVSMNVNGISEKIEYNYDASSLFSMLSPYSAESMNAIYEARTQKISNWRENDDYEYSYMATLNGFVEHLISNNIPCKYLPKKYNAAFWNEYDKDVNNRIVRFILEKNCKKLQEEIEIASANDKRQRKRTGKGNTALMEFIDSNLRDIGCY